VPPSVDVQLRCAVNLVNDGGPAHADPVGQVGQADRPAHVVDAQRVEEPPVVPGQPQPVDPVQREAAQHDVRGDLRLLGYHRVDRGLREQVQRGPGVPRERSPNVSAAPSASTRPRFAAARSMIVPSAAAE
jgi:hypothetical protein